MKNTTVNVFTENLYSDWDIDERKCIIYTRKIVKYFIKKFLDESCLNGFDFDTISFDILFCDSKKTHEINKEYRNKDYPADIITFAIFADSDEKFILDNEINLGEIILALDKVKEEARKNSVEDIYELYFLIAHGILHLLGFDHQTESEYNFIISAQKDVLKEVIGI